MKKRTWRDRKIDFLKMFFEKDAKRWENKTDDRKLFSNMYYMIVNAVMSLPEEPNNFVCCAMNEAINEEIQTMQKIQKVFEGR